MQLVDVTLARAVSDDLESVDPAETFGTRAKAIHALVRFADVTTAIEVEGAWIAIDAIDPPNYTIDKASVSVEPGAATAHFTLSKPNDDWPPGHYELVVSVDGLAYQSVPFSIEEGAPDSPSSGLAQGANPPGFGAAPRQPAPAGTQLVGSWQCRMSVGGNVVGAGVMTFDQRNQVTLDQSRFAYEVVSANRIRLQDQSGYYDYQFELAGDSLRMRYTDGSVFDCARQKSGSMGAIAGQPGASGGAGSANWQLRGTYCHYSGSSSYGSSYSSTTRIAFDGQGRWSMGSESSFSGDVGSAYGRGDTTSGSYEVRGRQILYRTDAGDQGYAEVHMQQNSGAITEIMVDGELYAVQLCD